MKAEKLQSLRREGFSPKAIRLIAEHVNIGRLPHPTSYAKGQNAYGDVLEMFLDVESGVIKDAKYLPCGYSGLLAAASAVTEFIKGKPVEEVKHVELRDLIEYLEGLPESKYACAQLAIETLKRAIKHIH